jgi:phosphoglycolate phosphatase
MSKFVPAERVDEALAIYRPHWDKTMLDGVELMPGARALLEALKSREVKTGVFTNKHGPSARRVCSHLKVDDLLDDVVGADDTAWLKPEPRFAHWALDRLQADPTTTCLVGDSPFDVAAAQRVDLAFVGVTTGTHDEAQLREAGAEAVFDDMVAIAREWGLA